jgi:hypothetical protein
LGLAVRFFLSHPKELRTLQIQKKFKELFEKSGHQLRSHAPYGDHAKVVAFLLQGRDICEQWSPKKKKTLTEDEFKTLTWQTVAKCIVKSVQDLLQANEFVIYPPEKVIDNYQRNKLMRILSSDLNGFNIKNHLLLNEQSLDVSKSAFYEFLLQE